MELVKLANYFKCESLEELCKCAEKKGLAIRELDDRKIAFGSIVSDLNLP